LVDFVLINTMNKTAYMYEYVINNLKKYIAVFIQKLYICIILKEMYHIKWKKHFLAEKFFY
jgi:hypothetical protein